MRRVLSLCACACVRVCVRVRARADFNDNNERGNERAAARYIFCAISSALFCDGKSRPFFPGNAKSREKTSLLSRALAYHNRYKERRPKKNKEREREIYRGERKI
jgi:hypothetical protein